MSYENITDPISDDQPCGPDLEEFGDDAYIDYYYEALARIPERFLQGGQPFDRKSIDAKAEAKQIGALLEKSRDIRLLVLEAQFQALGGTISGFSDCVQAIARLLDERYDDVHPQIVGGDVTSRRNTLELLDERSSVTMPLEHAPLFRDRRLDTVTFRDYQVASGQKDRRDGENPPDSSSIIAAVQSPENAEAVEKVYAALEGAKKAVSTIGMRCKLSQGTPFAPSLDVLDGCLGGLIKFFTDARPDLAADASTDTAAPEGDGGAEGDTSDASMPAGAAPVQHVPSGGPVAVGNVGSHADAAAALDAVAAYFVKIEPSSPGLILVKQARELIGKPLMEALEILLPGVAEKAKIDFGSEHEFSITVPRMKMLTGSAGQAELVPSDPANFVIENREAASATISNVETFYRQTEPSSPVPILLFKAKTYLSRDFSAIITDLFAHVDQGDG